MTLEMTLAAKDSQVFLSANVSGKARHHPQSVHSNESLHARSSNGVERVPQVLRGEGHQSEALIQLADENQPSVRRDLFLEEPL
jgi:hypothetical protein